MVHSIHRECPIQVDFALGESVRGRWVGRPRTSLDTPVDFITLGTHYSLNLWNILFFNNKLTLAYCNFFYFISVFGFLNFWFFIFWQHWGVELSVSQRGFIPLALMELVVIEIGFALCLGGILHLTEMTYRPWLRWDPLNFLPRLVGNLDPPDFCLLSS
jgi:hypothetical protein